MNKMSLNEVVEGGYCLLQPTTTVGTQERLNFREEQLETKKKSLSLFLNELTDALGFVSSELLSRICSDSTRPHTGSAV